MDPYKFLKISLNPDGTLSRHQEIPDAIPTGDNNNIDDSSSSSLAALSKDVTLNDEKKTWIRIFRPNIPPPSPTAKFPIILYFHGGGFILFSAATKLFNDSNGRVAAAVPAIVLSVEYRLAPEHRLPAAYDDGVDAVLWLQNQAKESETGGCDPWLRDYADFSSCFLMGSSSGGNIAYNTALRVLDLDVKPLNVVGLILNQPYFSGNEPTDSETRLAEDRILPLPANHLMWELALPEGSNRDHQFCNPIMQPSGNAARLPRCLLRGYAGDPLVDRQRDLQKMLEREGVNVVTRFDDDGFHGVEIFDPKKAEAFITDVKDFVLLHGGQKL